MPYANMRTGVLVGYSNLLKVPEEKANKLYEHLDMLFRERYAMRFENWQGVYRLYRDEGMSNIRFMWDQFWVVQPTVRQWLTSYLYSQEVGCNDDHITSMLRHYFKNINGVQML